MTEPKMLRPMSDLTDEARVSAVYALGMARHRHKDLSLAETTAKLKLVDAIITMDAAMAREAEEILGHVNPRHHSLAEQAAVNVAIKDYGQAMADLLRGEAS